MRLDCGIGLELWYEIGIVILDWDWIWDWECSMQLVLWYEIGPMGLWYEIGIKIWNVLCKMLHSFYNRINDRLETASVVSGRFWQHVKDNCHYCVVSDYSDYSDYSVVSDWWTRYFHCSKMLIYTTLAQVCRESFWWCLRTWGS